MHDYLLMKNYTGQRVRVGEKEREREILTTGIIFLMLMKNRLLKRMPHAPE